MNLLISLQSQSQVGYVCLQQQNYDISVELRSEEGKHAVSAVPVSIILLRASSFSLISLGKLIN